MQNNDFKNFYFPNNQPSKPWSKYIVVFYIVLILAILILGSIDLSHIHDAPHEIVESTPPPRNRTWLEGLTLEESQIILDRLKMVDELEKIHEDLRAMELARSVTTDNINNDTDNVTYTLNRTSNFGKFENIDNSIDKYLFILPIIFITIVVVTQLYL